jgi:hypothetical protein
MIPQTSSRRPEKVQSPSCRPDRFINSNSAPKLQKRLTTGFEHLSVLKRLGIRWFKNLGTRPAIQDEPLGSDDSVCSHHRAAHPDLGRHAHQAAWPRDRRSRPTRPSNSGKVQLIVKWTTSRPVPSSLGVLAVQCRDSRPKIRVRRSSHSRRLRMWSVPSSRSSIPVVTWTRFLRASRGSSMLAGICQR